MYLNAMWFEATVILCMHLGTADAGIRVRRESQFPYPQNKENITLPTFSQAAVKIVNSENQIVKSWKIR